MLTHSHLSTIIHAGRSALRRAGTDARLLDVAETYARAVLYEDPGHRDAMALFCDAEDVAKGRAGTRSAYPAEQRTR